MGNLEAWRERTSNYVSKSGTHPLTGMRNTGGITEIGSEFQLPFPESGERRCGKPGRPAPDSGCQSVCSLDWRTNQEIQFLFLSTMRGILLLIPSLFSVSLPTQQFENAVVVNLNNVSPVFAPFYNKLFGIWNATPGAAGAQNTLAVEVVRAVTTLAGGPYSEPVIRVLCNCRVELLRQQADHLIVGRYCGPEHRQQRTNRSCEWTARKRPPSPSYTHLLTSAFNAHSAQPELQSQLSETLSSLPYTFGANK